MVRSSLLFVIVASLSLGCGKADSHPDHQAEGPSHEFGFPLYSKPTQAIPGTRVSQTLRITPDGKSFVAELGMDKRVGVFDLASGTLLRELSGHESSVRSIHITKDNQTAITAAFDKTIRFWNIAVGAETKRFDFSDFIYDFAVTADEKYLVVALHSKVSVVEIATGQTHLTISDVDQEGKLNEFFYSVAVLSDGKSLITGGNLSVSHWDLTTGKRIRRFEATGLYNMPMQLSLVDQVAVSPDGSKLAAVTDQQIVLWDVNRGEHLNTFGEHGGKDRQKLDKTFARGGYMDWIIVGDIKFSSDSAKLVAGVRDAVRVWDVNSGDEVLRLRTTADESFLAKAVDVSADGKTVVDGGGEDFFRVWKLEEAI